VVGCNEFALIKKVDAAVSWIEADKRHWYTPAQGMCTTGYLHNVHGIVIPDCRQISEMKWVRYLGGKLIRVHGRTDSTDTHRTEIEQLAMPDSEMDLVINSFTRVLTRSPLLYDTPNPRLRRWDHRLR
jgi:hypothetical protein